MRRRQLRSNSSSRSAEGRQRVHRDHLGRVAGQAAGVERPAVEVHVVGVAVVGRIHGRDRPQRRRPQGRKLDAAEPAVGHAPRGHRAGAPRLRRHPRDDVVAVVLLGLGVLVLRPRPASCRCRAHPGAHRRTRRSRESCSATGPRSPAGRPCGRGCARGWRGTGRAGWGGTRRPRAARRRARSPRCPAREGRFRRRARGVAEPSMGGEATTPTARRRATAEAAAVDSGADQGKLPFRAVRSIPHYFSGKCRYHPVPWSSNLWRYMP